jgi:hypothetical protein
MRERAFQELESVLAESDKLADQPAVAVKIRARAANLLWSRDRARARELFRALWSDVAAQDEHTAWREAARTEILKNLFPRDPGLAQEMLKEATGDAPAQESGLRAQVTGTDPRTQRITRLSQELVESDATHAAAMIEQALASGVTPGAMSALIRLRDQNTQLADYVAAGTFERLKSRPTAVALTGLFIISDYVFPSSQMAGDSLLVNPPVETLRMQYFSAAYEVLQRSLREPEAALAKEMQYTEQDLRFRAVYQAQLAALLAAIAPRLAPQVAPELSALADKLASGLPPSISQISQYNSARLSGEMPHAAGPEVMIPLLMARGEFEEAKHLVEKMSDETTRTAYLQTIARVEFRNYLAKAELPQALAAARAVQDPNPRAMLYVQLASVADKKGDKEFAKLVVAEARATLASSAPDGLRTRALLLLTADATSLLPAQEAVELLQSATASINALSRPATGADAPTPQQAAWAVVNDPLSLMDAPELQQAFAAAGRVDFDSTSFAAHALNEKPVALSARLALAARWLADDVKPAVAPVVKIAPPGKPAP